MLLAISRPLGLLVDNTYQSHRAVRQVCKAGKLQSRKLYRCEYYYYFVTVVIFYAKAGILCCGILAVAVSPMCPQPHALHAARSIMHNVQ